MEHREKCCNCCNRGMCKSCNCSKPGKRCDDTCLNVNCQYKAPTNVQSKSRTTRTYVRVTPYASSSHRNTPQAVSVEAGASATSPNDVMEARLAPEREQEDGIKAILNATVDRMTEEEKTGALRRLVQAIPQEMFRALAVVPPPQSDVQWCVCHRCRQMEDPRMNLCCGHVSCITTRDTFNNICLRADVLEVANILNWSHMFNDEPSFEPAIFRNQGYRNFVLWQWGRLGPGNRRVVPSCVVLAIRAKFPSPNDQYTGYHSSEEF